MGSYDGIFVNSYRYAPFNPDRLTAQKGFDAADNMMTYAACRANFNLKRYAVLAQGWQIVPAVTDPLGDTRHAQAKAYSDFAAWCLNNIASEAGVIQDFRSVLFELLRAAWDGFKVSEIGYRYLDAGPYQGPPGLRWLLRQARQADRLRSEPAHLAGGTHHELHAVRGLRLLRFRSPGARCIRTTRRAACRTAWAIGAAATSTGSAATT